MTDTVNPARERIDQAITDLERLKMNVASIEARYQILGDNFSNLLNEFLSGIKKTSNEPQSDSVIIINDNPVVLKTKPVVLKTNFAAREVMEIRQSEVIEPGLNVIEVEDNLSSEKEPSVAVETKAVIKSNYRRRKKRKVRLEPTMQRPAAPAAENQIVVESNDNPVVLETTKPVILKTNPIVLKTNPASSVVIEPGRSEVIEPAIERRRNVVKVREQELPEEEFSDSHQVYQSSLTDIIGTYTVNNIPKGDARQMPTPLKAAVRKNAIDVAADGIEKGLDFIGNCFIYPVDKIVRLFSSKPRSRGK